jgi:hypothetical protein
VLKIEIGKPHDFDRPSSKEEALDRLERAAGPHARKMLERFLEQVKEVEAKYLEEKSTDWSIFAALLAGMKEELARHEGEDWSIAKDYVRSLLCRMT